MEEIMKLKMSRKARENMLGYAFVSIWIIGFLIFTLIPIVRTFLFSFHKITITADGIRQNFIGMSNYGTDEMVSRVCEMNNLEDGDKIYVGEIILYVPIVIVFALAISLILNMKLKGKGFFRTLFFLPVIIISGPVMEEFIDQGVTSIQGVDQMSFYKDLIFALPEFLGTLLNTLVNSFVMILWFSGVQILIFLSALQKIDRPIYEAAQIDGASRWEAFWKITLPTMRPMIILNIVYTIISISTFTLNEVIIVIQENSFSSTTGLGYAAALAWIYFIILLLIIGIFMLLYGPKKENPYGEKIKKQKRKGGRHAKVSQ